MKSIRINKKWLEVLLHIAAWLVVFSLPYLLRPPYDPQRGKNPDSEGFFYLNMITNFFWVGLFYLNANILVERFIYGKKYIQYIVVLLATFCLIMVFHGFLFTHLIKRRPFVFLVSAGFNLTTFLLTVAASIIYKLIWDKSKTDRLLQEKQEENLKSELSFLRSQISPHFIFNVLNNMVALVRLKSDELEPTIMKLSNLMQYMLYETDEEKVLLKTEVEYLQSYIDLQQQRFGTKVKLHVLFDVKEDWLSIEPMMLIPFVENAFKHGVGMIEKPAINIKLYTKDKDLFFEVSNRFNDTAEEVKDKTSGIGLHNVSRRLNLLYGKQHDLLITKKDGWFSVSLKLNLH
ncbi:MAG: two-component system sensor protein no kinase domain [Segetibacter sp.]|jgi:two-component system LytT family sensor kinase|nr:two-component system sensor protein no kinase domain [Segetibacter sp.]